MIASRPTVLVAFLALYPLTLILPTVSCKLTPVQAVEATAVSGPLCDAIGGGVSVLSNAAGQEVALLCSAIASDIIRDETVVPLDGGPPGSVNVTAPLPVLATPGCVPVKVVGDPFGEWACPELHERVRKASGRRMVGRVGK